MNPKSDISLTNISKYYNGEMIFQNLSLTLSAEKKYCLMAPSGTGKTTLFRILMGLETPDTGTITGLPKRRIAAVFQEDRLLEEYTAMENIRFAVGRKYPEELLRHALLRLLPEDSLKKPVCEFSGGMKRRTAILRALLVPSDMILMDEPFTGLDTATKTLVIDMIKEYTEKKLLLTATHNPEDAALLGAEIIYLKHKDSEML